MPINKAQWFDIPDSLTEREDGQGKYHNVRARFVDHPVLNPEKSRIKRANVYDIGIAFLTEVKRGPGDVKAQPNRSALVLRFDKGNAQPKGNWIAAKAAIERCPAAWEHYQKFRRAPVTATEQLALAQIQATPEAPKGVLVDTGDGEIVRMEFDPDKTDEDEGDGAVEPAEPEPAADDTEEPSAETPSAPKPRGRRKASDKAA